MAGNSTRADSEGIKDRIHGTILASACGNSLGGSSIGLSRKEILASTGFSRLRDFTPGLSRSQLPDHKAGNLLSDTYLALTFAQALINSGGRFDVDELRKEFTKLIEDPEFLDCQPGAVTLGTMRCVIDATASGLECFNLTDLSSAVCAFPCGCLPGKPKTESAVDLAIAQCKAAYSNESVMAAAAVIADSVHYFVTGNKIDSPSEVRIYVERELEVAKTFDQRFADAWDGVAPDLDYSSPASDLPYSLINVESNVTELIPTAVGIFLIFRHSLEEAICAAALSGGDTDTVAAVVGALAGAYHGANSIPDRWLSGIAHKERLDKVGDGLAALWN